MGGRYKTCWNLLTFCVAMNEGKWRCNYVIIIGDSAGLQ